MARLDSPNSSAVAASAASADLQQFLGGYWLLSQLSAGELCTVHRARSIVSAGDRAEVALKRLRADKQDGPARARLLREARLGFSLRSAQLARVFEIHDEPELFVVMEYVEGATLRELLLRAPGRDALLHLAPMFVDTLRGLSALHNYRDDEGAPGFLVHQAPSTGHMLVGLDGVTRLIDLSHAHVRTSVASAFAIKASVGTLAPEQRAGADLDPRCDIFLVGSALRDALTRALAQCAGAADEASLRARCAPLLALAERAAKEKRSVRFWSADEMAYRLERAALDVDLLPGREAVGAFLRDALGPVRQPRGLPRVNPRVLESSASASAPTNVSVAARVTRLPPAPRAVPAAPVNVAPARPVEPPTLPPELVVAVSAPAARPSAPPPTPAAAAAVTPPPASARNSSMPPPPPAHARVTPLPAPRFAGPRESALLMLPPPAGRASQPLRQRSRARRIGVAGGIVLITGAFALGVRGFHDTATASATARLLRIVPVALPAAVKEAPEPTPIVTSLAPPPRARASAAPRTEAVPPPPVTDVSTDELEGAEISEQSSDSSIHSIADSIRAVSSESERNTRARPVFLRPRQLREELPVNPY